MNIQNPYRHTIYASYLGYITQAIVNNLAPLLFLIFRAEYGFSLRQITLLTTINFAVQLLVDLISAKWIDKIGYRISVVMAHVFAAVGLVGMAVFPSVFSDTYVGMLFAVILYAIGGGIIEVLISPIVEACPSDHKASAMSLLHSFYCWGTVAVVFLSTCFLQIAGKEHWRLLCLLWAILPVANGFYFSKVPIYVLVEENEGMSIRELVKNKMFWLFFLLMIMAGASEQGMSQWASAFAESGLHLSKVWGDIAGPCFFSLLMGLSRAHYGKHGERMDLLKYILASAVLCVLSYGVVVFAPYPLLSLLGCGMCGLSVGILWPGVFSLASKELPKGGTAMFALLALSGDVGCSGGPTLVGSVANVFGDDLKMGLLSATVFPMILILCACILKKRKIS